MPKKAANQSLQVAAKHIKRYLDSHPGMPVSTAVLAQKFGISRNALQKIFKEKNNQSIGKYKLGLRLNEAKALLMSGRSIKEVSIMLQYSSASSFSNAFSNFFKVSAKQWLQETKHNGDIHDNV